MATKTNMKTFPYAVIFNGKFIPANTPIEVEGPEKEAPQEEKAEKPKRAVRKNAIKQ